MTATIVKIEQSPDGQIAIVADISNGMQEVFFATVDDSAATVRARIVDRLRQIEAGQTRFQAAQARFVGQVITS